MDSIQFIIFTSYYVSCPNKTCLEITNTIILNQIELPLHYEVGITMVNMVFGSGSYQSRLVFQKKIYVLQCFSMYF